MRPAVDWGLYLVTGRDFCLGRPVERVIEAAARGGVTAVQLREKNCTTREFVALGRRVKKLLAPLGLPLFINDRSDVALAVAAEGLHIGQSDMPCPDARRLMGDDALIGLSVDTPEQALAAEELDVDYLGVGPVFPTQTKKDTSPELGPEGLRALRGRSRHVLIGIGGLDALNSGEAIAAGADGIAVVSAICSADDVEAAARQIRDVIDRAKEARGPTASGR